MSILREIHEFRLLKCFSPIYIFLFFFFFQIGKACFRELREDDVIPSLKILIQEFGDFSLSV